MVAVRPASERDIAEVCRILNETYHHKSYDVVAAVSNYRIGMKNDPNCHLLVAAEDSLTEDKTIIAGTVTLRLLRGLDGIVASYENLAIDTPHEGKGILALLIDKLGEIAKKYEARVTWVTK